jgi:hypothetical protein
MIVLLWVFMLGTSFAKPLSHQFEDKKLYYSALNEFFYETYNKPVANSSLERLEKLLFFTGIELLEDYELSLLEKYPTSSIHFILARRYFKKKEYKKSQEHLKNVKAEHRYFPESQLLKGQIFGDLGQFDDESESYFSCQKTAEREEHKASNEKIKRYYRMIHEICLINKARRLFKQGHYKESIDAYDQVPKKSYKWPYVLLEKAWAYYHLGDYNRSLGLLITYKSPLLDTYFFPEAEYLAALNYLKLCLYDDSLTIINQYYQFYRPRFNQLEKFLSVNLKSQDYFYNLMFKHEMESKDVEDFAFKIVTRLKKQTRFSLDFNTIYKINKEIEAIYSSEDQALKRRLIPHLNLVKENIISKINYNAKEDIFNFLETVPFFSSQLFKIQLETLSKKKDLIYTGRTLISDRSRGDYENVKRSRFEYFWKFEGAFWADELGDYSLGLKSNCELNKDHKSESAK